MVDARPGAVTVEQRLAGRVALLCVAGDQVHRSHPHLSFLRPVLLLNFPSFPAWNANCHLVLVAIPYLHAPQTPPVYTKPPHHTSAVQYHPS